MLRKQDSPRSTATAPLRELVERYAFLLLPMCVQILAPSEALQSLQRRRSGIVKNAGLRSTVVQVNETERGYWPVRAFRQNVAKARDGGWMRRIEERISLVCALMCPARVEFGVENQKNTR
jgi:hypothetical protein